MVDGVVHTYQLAKNFGLKRTTAVGRLRLLARKGLVKLATEGEWIGEWTEQQGVELDLRTGLLQVAGDVQAQSVAGALLVVDEFRHPGRGLATAGRDQGADGNQSHKCQNSHIRSSRSVSRMNGV